MKREKKPLRVQKQRWRPTRVPILETWALLSENHQKSERLETWRPPKADDETWKPLSSRPKVEVECRDLKCEFQVKTTKGWGRWKPKASGIPLPPKAEADENHRVIQVEAEYQDLKRENHQIQVEAEYQEPKNNRNTNKTYKITKISSKPKKWPKYPPKPKKMAYLINQNKDQVFDKITKIPSKSKKRPKYPQKPKKWLKWLIRIGIKYLLKLSKYPWNQKIIEIPPKPKKWLKWLIRIGTRYFGHFLGFRGTSNIF